MNADPSNGSEGVAERFIAARSDIGVATVRKWAQSLGAEEYGRIAKAAGMALVGGHVDEGENHYFDALKP